MQDYYCSNCHARPRRNAPIRAAAVAQSVVQLRQQLADCQLCLTASTQPYRQCGVGQSALPFPVSLIDTGSVVEPAAVVLGI